MKSAAIARLREITRLKYEAATTIRGRLAQSEADVEGWDENDATAGVWELLRRGEGYGVTRGLIEKARAKAIREAEAQNVEHEDFAAEVAIVHAIHDAAGDVLEALTAFVEAARSDPDEVADLVDEAESANDLARKARVQLALIDAAAAVRATVHEALTRLAVDLCQQDTAPDEAEQAIREMAFEDEP